MMENKGPDTNFDRPETHEPYTSHGATRRLDTDTHLAGKPSQIEALQFLHAQSLPLPQIYSSHPRPNLLVLQCTSFTRVLVDARPLQKSFTLLLKYSSDL